MKTLVICYSYTRKTKKLAMDVAKKESADLLEVKEKKARSKFNAYLFGSFAARGRRPADLQDFTCGVGRLPGSDVRRAITPLRTGLPQGHVPVYH